MIANTLFRLSLRLYPGGFREEYEAEMERMFAALCARDGAAAALARAWRDAFIEGLALQLDTVHQDVRQAVRKLRGTPGLTLLVIVMTAVGVGANSAIYSLADALLFRPLRPDTGEQLVVVQRAWNREPMSLPDFRDLRDRSTSFSQLAAFTMSQIRWTTAAGADERLTGEMVTGNYFETLGVLAHRGRLISPEDDAVLDARPVAVISHDLWKTRFVADESLVGRELILAGRRFTVIGVAEEGFHGSALPAVPRIWDPLAMRNTIWPTLRSRETERGSTWLVPIARLRDGVSQRQAEAEANVIDEQIQREHPDVAETTEAGRRDRRFSIVEARGVTVPHLRRMALGAAGLLLAASAFLLLIACANTANILLARGLTRARETAVRLALGAGRRRMVRQLLTESLLLAFLGALAGVAVAYATMNWLGDLRTPEGFGVQYAAFARIDRRVLLYAMAVAAVSGVVFGFAPAVAASRLDVHSALKEGAPAARGGGRGSRRLRFVLIGGQVALSAVLLAGCGMFLTSLRAMVGAEPGFSTQGQAFLTVNFFGTDYNASRREQFFATLKRRLEALPNMQSVSIANHPPLDVNNATMTLRPPVSDQATSAEIRVAANSIDEDYFRAAGFALLQGRAFLATDRLPSAACVTIVNEVFARRYWPGGDWLGRRVTFTRDRAGECSVVGVSAVHKYNNLAEDPQPAVYRTLLDSARSVNVRVAGLASPLLPQLRAAVRDIDPAVEVRSLATADELVDLSRWPTRLGAQFLSGLAVAGLLLTALGVFGVTSFLTEQRRHEIGVRLALGAQPTTVARLVIGMGLKLIAAGLAVGLLIAIATLGYLQSVLYGVRASDPSTYLAVMAVLLGTAVAATALPAWRAARTNPLDSLRAN
jgi:predicted permease